MIENRVVAAGCLAALAGTCAPVHAQDPVRIADGHWEFPCGATCGKAEAAARALTARSRVEEDPWGVAIIREAMGDTDVLNCNLEFELFPATETLTGSNTFTIKSRVNGLTQFTFRLRNQFTITSATINGSTPVTVTSPATTTRLATLDRAYNAEELFTLTIAYTGVPFSPSGSNGAVDFTTQNGLPMFQTLSEPYYAYTWWPCKDGDTFQPGDNSDKFTAQIAITAPDTMSSVSNGVLQGVDVLSGARRRFRWATAMPTVTYNIFVNSTTYNQWEQTYTYPLPGGGTGSMPVHFSLYPANDSPANRAAWELCIPMLAAFRPFYGEYPFVTEKYGIYNFNFGGGMEHQTYTGQGTFSEGVTAHEVGHQWWGDMVTCKTWHDIWLNEGFATFSEALWFQHKPGSTGWPAYFSRMNTNKPTAVSGTVYRTDVSSTSVIFSSTYAYRKAGWAVHMLRGVVGDATFWDILAAYRAQYAGTAATTEDFKNVASAVYGQDLSWFINEWIMGPGAPAYAGGWQTVNIGGQNYLRLCVRQTQVGTYPVFTMPVNVRINTSAGTQYARVWNDAATEWYVIPINAPATGIVLDESSHASPSPWILTTDITSEAFVNGPPKVVQSSVLPGATIGAGLAPSQITVGFSENVTAPAAAYMLSGPGGNVPLTVSYNAGTFAATLDAGAPLAPGAYTLTVSPTVVASASGIALDGEFGALPAPAPAITAFPTGDGQPGGAATWTFTVEGAQTCYANCDESTAAPILNVSDFTCFLQRFAGADPYANCDGSTAPPVLNVSDFTCFLQQFAGGCP